MTAEGTVHVVCGIVGSGKTTLAKQLAADLPALRLSRDEWMLRLYDWPYDDPRYIDALEACTDLMWDVAIQAIGIGQSVVLDWNHWSRDRRAESAERARAAGGDFVVHFVDVPIDTAVRQATARTDGESHLLNEAGVRHSATILEPPSDDEGLVVIRHCS